MTISSKPHPPFDQQAARAALEASLPLMLECPAAAWALMSSSWSKEKSAGLDPSAPESLAGFRARYFLQEKALEFAAADAAAGLWPSDRQTMIRRLIGLDRAEALEPYLRAYPERARYEAFSAEGEELLGLCERGQLKPRCLRLWSELKLIAGTAKRANQALASGQPEVSAAIRKPTLASFRDYLKEHPARWGTAAAAFFEPVVKAALAKVKPGSAQELALKEAFSPQTAVAAQVALGRNESPRGPAHASAEALRLYYQWMPESSYQEWASASPLPALIFLERSGQWEALERLARQPAIEALARGQALPPGALAAVASPEGLLARGASIERAYGLAMYGAGAMSKGPAATLIEAALLAFCPRAAQMALAAGQSLPTADRLRAIVKACPEHYFGHEREGEGPEARLRKALALRESFELGALLPAQEKKRRAGPL